MTRTSSNISIQLHPLLLRAVAQGLASIFKENRHADKVIEQILRQNPKAGSRDRAFIAETIYEIVRYYRLYTEILGRSPKTEPDYWQLAGIHLVVAACKISGPGSDMNFQLPTWQEFKSLNTKEIQAKFKLLNEQRALRESIPDWLDQRCSSELAEDWDATLHALNQPAKVVLRANTLKTSRTALQKALQLEGVETQTIGQNDALQLGKRQNLFQTKAFKNGLFEMQDYSSQQVAGLLAPAPGMRVVDACAGGGGKTLHLAALLQNKGNLVALDTVAWKLDALRLRARRAGANNIETRTIDNNKVIKRLHNSADRLLLDVPCSGLGVLRRNPDAKWKITPESIENLRTTQKDILQNYCLITKPGGRMVYATCSILPSENQEQVQNFLSSETGKNFRLLQEKRILPQDEGFDGFYMALIERLNH